MRLMSSWNIVEDEEEPEVQTSAREGGDGDGGYVIAMVMVMRMTKAATKAAKAYKWGAAKTTSLG